MEISVLGYVALGLVVVAIFGFAIWRSKTGRNEKNK